MPCSMHVGPYQSDYRIHGFALDLTRKSRSGIGARWLLFSAESALIGNTTTATRYVIDPAKRLTAPYEIA
jgi:hypothetical protein